MKSLVNIICLLSAFTRAQDHGEHEEHCPPENPNCHVPTGVPTPNPTPGPSTPYPTFIYSIDFADTIETKVYPDDGTEMDYYGFATAINHNTAIVGAYGSKDKGQNSGSVYIYTTNATTFPYYDDGTTPWTFVQKLVVEHWEERCNKEGCEYVEVNDHQAENGQFGYSLAVWGDTIVVGAHRQEAQHAGGGGVYIYQKASSGLWTTKQVLSADDGHAYHYFGYSTAIYDDTIILGAAGDEHGGVSSGSAYVYEYDGEYDAWFQVAKLTTSSAQAFDNFGAAVDVYKKYAVIGATGDTTLGTDAGAAFVYVRFGTWVQEYKLVASDGDQKHYFGCSVSVYEDTVAVGAYQGHGHWDYAGAVYIYTVNADGIWTLQSKVVAHDGMSEDKFGWSLSLYKDTVVVGAYGEMGKEVDEPKHRGRKLQGGAGGGGNHNGDEHGENCGPNSPPDCEKYEGEYSYRGASTGSVYVFARSGSTWLQEFKLIADGSASYDSFGKSVAMHENVVFVGADMADGMEENTGM